MMGITKKNKIYFIIVFTLLITSCINSKKCNNEILEIENSYFQNKELYRHILTKFIEDNNTIKNDFKKQFLRLKINYIRKCKDYEKGEYEINFIVSEQCDYVIQSINLRYSNHQLVCKKTNKIEIKQLDKNWYLVIIKD